MVNTWIDHFPVEGPSDFLKSRIVVEWGGKEYSKFAFTDPRTFSTILIFSGCPKVFSVVKSAASRKTLFPMERGFHPSRTLSVFTVSERFKLITEMKTVFPSVQ